MKKLMKIFAVATLVITASVANAQIDRETGIGIGASLWYSQYCESNSEKGWLLLNAFLFDENITGENVLYQPGIAEGYNDAKELGCKGTKLIMQDTGMYDVLF